jgi:hypothetical protein
MFKIKKKFKLILQDKKVITVIVNYLLLAAFIYTLLNAGDQQLKYNKNLLENENIFRNAYFYFIYLLTTFMILKKNYNKKIVFIFYTIIPLIFYISLKNYIENREYFINDRLKKGIILKNELSRHVNLERSIVAYYRYSNAYGFGDEIFFLEGNGNYGNERFNEQIIDLYPDYRWFRLPMIINEISRHKEEMPNLNKYSDYRKFQNKYEKFINYNFNNFFFKIFSTTSDFLYPSKNFNKEIYSEQNNQKYKKPDLLLYNHAYLYFHKITNNEIQEYLIKNESIAKILTINVEDDIWQVYILNENIILK